MLRITVRTSAMSGRFRPFTICVNLGEKTLAVPGAAGFVELAHRAVIKHIR